MAALPWSLRTPLVRLATITFCATVAACDNPDLPAGLTSESPGLTSSGTATSAFTVNTTDDADDGVCNPTHCSLREAINGTNATAAADEIHFAIPGAGPHTISPGSALPAITKPVTIDGYTQTGASPNTGGPGEPNDATLMIELEGSSAGVNVDGVWVKDVPATIRGLVINRFSRAGIRLEDAEVAVVEGCWIGVDVSGTGARPNSMGIGLFSGDGSQVIGGTAPAARNLISGNSSRGILMSGTMQRVRVQNNFIGTDLTGTVAVANGAEGLALFGTSTGAGPSNNLIGGLVPEARNVVSGNRDDGIFITGIGANGNLVQGNFVGTDLTGTQPLPNLAGVVVHESPLNTIGGRAEGARNIISGNRNSGVGITASSSVVVEGNFIGTDVSGTEAVPNGGGGVTMANGLENRIGGDEPAARNIISGNGGHGISASGFSATGQHVIQGNYIGTDVTGTHALGNSSGISFGTGTGNTVGGTRPGARNVIAGNRFMGVELSGTNSVVIGNWIGLAANGIDVLGTGRSGVFIGSNARNNTVGGHEPGSGNRIVGSGFIVPGAGIQVVGGTGHAILRNELSENAGLGIDLMPPTGGAGITPNDDLDSDIGTNNFQNFPVLNRARTDGLVEGSLRSSASASFRIELFANAECDPSGNGEGERFLAAFDVSTDAAGVATFSTSIAGGLTAGEHITATTTDAGNNTSEFSACERVAGVNATPTVSAGGPYTGVEGSPIALSLGGSDSDGDALTYTWDLGDGTTGSGITPPASHTYGDNPAPPATAYTITLSVDDGKGGTATASTTATVANADPAATLSAPASADEGNTFTLSLVDPQDVAADLAELEYRFDCGSGTGFGPWGSAATADCPTADEGTRAVEAEIRDGDGGLSSYEASVLIQNLAPSGLFTAPSSVDEGSSFPIALTKVQDVPADQAEVQYRFDCGAGFADWGAVPSRSCATDDNGTRAVRGEIRDQDGGSRVHLASVTVANVGPRLGGVVVPLDPIAVGHSVTASSSYTDPGTADTHQGFVQWDADGAFDPAAPGVNQSGKTLTAASALSAGVYSISLRIRDDDGAEDTRSAGSYVVVYDPTGGFVTGGGWINSPAGAYAPDPRLTGKATFGFVTKYQKGAHTPSGNTEFQFVAGSMRFKSSSYDWLVVAGTQAKFKGEGTINGGGQFRFLLTAVDEGKSGEADKFRIKIWDKVSGGVVYDNRAGEDEESGAATQLGGGNIVIHR